MTRNPQRFTLADLGLHGQAAPIETGPSLAAGAPRDVRGGLPPAAEQNLGSDGQNHRPERPTGRYRHQKGPNFFVTETRIDGDGRHARASSSYPPYDTSPYGEAGAWDASGQGWEPGSPWNGAPPSWNGDPSSVSSTQVIQGESMSVVEPDALDPDYVSNGPPSRDPLFDTPMPWADLPWEKEREAQAARYAAGPYEDGSAGTGSWNAGDPAGYGAAARPDPAAQPPWEQPGGQSYGGNGNGHTYGGNGNGHTYGGNGNGNGHTYGGNGYGSNGYGNGNGYPTGVPFKSYQAASGLTNPGVTSPGVTNPGVSSTGVSSPGMTNPGMTSPGMAGSGTSAGMTSPGVANPGYTNGGYTSPGMPAAGMTNPGTSPGMTSPGYTSPGMPAAGMTNPGTNGTGFPGQPYPQGPGVNGTGAPGMTSGMGTNGAGVPPAPKAYAGPPSGQWGYPPTAPGMPPAPAGMEPVQVYAAGAPTAAPAPPSATITARATTSPGMRAARRAKPRIDSDITIAELSPPGRHERSGESGGRRTFVENAVTAAHAAAIEDARLLTALRALVSSRTLYPRVIFLAAGFAAIGPLGAAYAELMPLPVGARYILLPASLLTMVLCFFNRVWGRRAMTGYFAGVVATIVYDCVRWSLIPVGIWEDPIPGIGRLLLDDPDALWVWGYVWRFFGNGAGMGMAFAMLPWRGVKSGVVYGGLIATGLMMVLYFFPVAQAHFFPLTPLTFIGGYIGHFVYGGMLGWITSYLMPPPTDPAVRLQEFAETELPR